MQRNKRRYIAVFLLMIYVLTAVSLPVFAADEKIVVVIDAGHGGHDGGTDAGIRTEKEYNLIIAQYLEEELSADDRFTVIMTRTDDTYLKFLPRAMVALENNADVLISLHCNSNTAAYVKGNMAYCSVVDRFDAGELAGMILDEISAAVSIDRGRIEYIEDTGDSLGVYYWNNELQWDMPGAWSLGMKSDYYSINTWASKFGIPSIIVEHGYLSNPDEAAVIDKDENLRAIAKAEAKAIIDYFTNHTHTFGEKTVDFPSNCTLTGTQSYRCTVCGMKTATEALAPKTDGHYWRQSASAANSCTTDGYKEFVCQISYNLNDKGYPCTVHSYTETLAATGHNYTVIEDTQAGHGFDGRFAQTCTNCGNVTEEIRWGEPHSYEVTEESAPTCETEGKTVFTCTVCGGSYEEKRAALGHTWRETEYVPATATEDGWRDFVCDICGAQKRETDFACEHEYVREERLPTCEENGVIIETCSICGYTVTEDIPALGHDYIKQMDVASTCTAAGFYKGKCSVCGDIVTETYPLAEHSLEVKEETLSGTVFTCTACGHEETKEKERGSLTELFTSPAAAAIIGVIVIQAAIVGVIVYNHRKRIREEEERRRRFYEGGESSEESSEDPSIDSRKAEKKPSLKD